MVIRPEALTRQLDFTFEEPKLVRRIWPVRELVSHVCQQVEQEYCDIWVEGEISNCRPAPSGHLYFTLKDSDAQLPVVLFRRHALLLRFKPTDGLHVLVRGRVSVYAQRGQLQLVGETIEPVGAGSLQLAFEQLKEKLKAEGLFDSARKRPLPAYPRTVGIVTSPTGAVIQDFLNIVGRRHAALNVLVCPVAVQGESAIGEVEVALANLNASERVDVIVVARGGGSAEDLAAFNSERVARAIIASRLPVVSAVGHETDITIADFVADLRAPTPSAAAEIITEAQHRVMERVENQVNRLERASRFQLLNARQKLDRVPIDRAERRLSGTLRRITQKLDELEVRLNESVNGLIRARQREVGELAADVLHHEPRQMLARMRDRLGVSQTRIERSAERTVRRASARVQALDARLRSLSPLAVLERGYALVIGQNGTVIRSIGQLQKGERVTTRLTDGDFGSIVDDVRTKTKSAE
ncbi:MAG: exodeoxyribonuclease VII large subunit [Acidobacteria bacterium]|nr:exodeoxyribonuclease VII large subunit [Acidobacteriota bacterium]